MSQHDVARGEDQPSTGDSSTTAPRSASDDGTGGAGPGTRGRSTTRALEVGGHGPTPG